MMGVPLRGKNTAIYAVQIATMNHVLLTWRAAVVTLMCHAVDRLSTVWVMVFLV